MMKRPVDHRSVPVCGFVEPWSFAAGEAAGLHLSSADPNPAIRVVGLDDGEIPAGASGWTVTPLAAVAVRSLPQGGWLEIPLPPDRLVSARNLAVQVECLITHNPTPRSLIAIGHVSLSIAPSGVSLDAGDREGRTGPPLRPDVWMTITVSVVGMRVDAVIAGEGVETALSLVADIGGLTHIRLGLDDAETRPTANARYARPALLIDGVEVASWQFPPGPPVSELAPVLGDWPPLRIHNAPTFGMTSSRWTGEVHDPRLDASQYDALHCHDSDLGALDWPATHRLRAPEGAPAGIYAAEVATSRGTERIPFFLRSRTPRASIAFLVPTLTYLAYADENLPPAHFPWVCDDRGHRFARENDLLSLYDRHSDGSGVSLTTTRRPKLTLRDDYRYPLSGSPHLLPVDLRLLRFCRDQGIAFDLVTDHDLHREGAAALSGYQGVFTGSHPEYWTTPMQNGLAQFIARGGSLAYLGGNGFMWVSAVLDDTMEIRRGQGLGARTWDGRPGETNLSLTGEIGGLWRERGRSEFSVTGIGMTMMGFSTSRPYVRTPASLTAEHAWIFEGVDEQSFGADGTVLGGVAGYEVDRRDAALGTHPDTVTLATATGFDDHYLTDPNEFFPTAADRADARRAEMVIRLTPQGGIIFGAGSVAWCGALPDQGSDNDVGRITANILRRVAR